MALDNPLRKLFALLRPSATETPADSYVVGRDPDDDRPNPGEMVTIRRYRDLSEAIVARSLLESTGMRVELRDENLVRLDWQISNFIGGIRLQVEQADSATATELLDQPPPEIIGFAGPFDSSDPEYEQPRCPVCGSLEITFEGASRGAALTGLWMMGLPLPTGPETWSCAHCGARWQDNPPGAPPSRS